MLKVYITELKKNFEPGLFSDLLEGFPQAERAGVQRFVRIEDRQRTLAGRLLCERIFQQQFNVSILNHLEYDYYNRPFQTLIPNVDFNLSHGGKYVICAITDNGRIGVDIEEIRPINFEIADQYFTEEECRQLEQLEGKRKLGHFFLLWSLKEAYLKARGCTFQIPLDSFYFDFDSSGKIQICHKFKEENNNSNMRIQEKKFTFKTHGMLDGYSCAVCSHSDESYELKNYDINDLTVEAVFSY